MGCLTLKNMGGGNKVFRFLMKKPAPPYTTNHLSDCLQMPLYAKQSAELKNKSAEFNFASSKLNSNILVVDSNILVIKSLRARARRNKMKRDEKTGLSYRIVRYEFQKILEYGISTLVSFFLATSRIKLTTLKIHRSKIFLQSPLLSFILLESC